MSIDVHEYSVSRCVGGGGLAFVWRAENPSDLNTLQEAKELFVEEQPKADTGTYVVFRTTGVSRKSAASLTCVSEQFTLESRPPKIG